MFKKTLIIVACFVAALSLYYISTTGIQTQVHPLSRNDLALHLVSYEDPQYKLSTPYGDILLIHGLNYSSRQFDLNIRKYSLARYLAEQGFRVWLLDITGYGESEKPENGFTVNTEYAVEDINAATDYILHYSETNKIDILGWSWGTITTSQFAAKYPEKVNKLVLYAPIIYSLGKPAPQTDYQPFDKKSAGSDFNPAKMETDVLDAYLDQVEHDDKAGSPNGSRQDVYQPKHVQLIPYQQLKIPTLFIAGDQDPYVSAKKDLTLLIDHTPKGSCGIILQGGGHGLFLEKSLHQVFQSDVAEFLINGCKQHAIEYVKTKG